MTQAMDLGRDPIPALLMRFSIPAITGMVVNALYNVVDRIFIGQGVGPVAFSSLTVTAPLSVIILAFAMLVGFGCAPLISISLGRQDKEAAERIVGNGLTLLVVLSILIAVLGILFMHPILVFLGGSEDTLGYAEAYMRIIYYGVVFQMVGFGMTHMMRASGNPRASMNTMLLGAVMNIILDPIFIFGFGWGVEGAAYATIISQFASMVYVLNYFMGKKSVLAIRGRHLNATPRQVWRIFSVGVSSFATQIAASVVIAVANRQIQLHGGDTALGAMGIITSFGMLFLMPVFGLNQGAQPIVGYNFGAERFDRVKQTLKYTLTAAGAICLVGWLAVELAPGVVIRLFTQDPELAEASRLALRVFFLLLPTIGPQILCTVFFQAIGRARMALTLSMLRQVIILIPMYLLLPRYFGILGVWLAGPVTDCLAFVITMWVFTVNIRKLGTEILPETERSGEAAQEEAVEEFAQEVAAQTATVSSQSARFLKPGSQRIKD